MNKLLCVLLWLITCSSYGQTLNDLKAPTVPAAYMFGYEESNVERPTTPKSFTTQLQSAIKSGTLAPGIALEVAPFWLVNKTNYDINAYLSDRNYGRLIGRSLAFSLATSQTDSISYGKLKKGTGFALGFRVSLYQGHFSTAALSKIRIQTDTIQLWHDIVIALGFVKSDMRAYVAAKTPLTKALVEASIDNNFNAMPNSGGTKTAAENARVNTATATYIKNLLAQKAKDDPSIYTDYPKLESYLTVDLFSALNISKHVVEAATNLMGLLSADRSGSSLELSGAFSNIMQDNMWSQTTFAKSSIWLTYGYRFDNSNSRAFSANTDQSFDILSVARLNLNNLKDSVEKNNTFDLGIKLAYRIKRFNLSAEFVSRLDITKNGGGIQDWSSNAQSKFWTYRLTASLQYQINSMLGIYLSTGRTFDGNTTTFDASKGSLFTALGLNFGLNALTGTGTNAKSQ